VSDNPIKPVAWITKEQLEQVEDESCDAWVYWAETGHVAEADEIALFTAAQLKQAEQRAYERAARACEKFSSELNESGKTKAISAARVSALTCAFEIRALMDAKD
jgi:ferric-dicitrate binding protein FerR (iron transport regulator)